MTRPFARDISGPGQTRQLRDLLQGVLVCELLKPSKELWIFFAWLSDVEVIDNSARQFGSLCPDWPSANIRLSTILRTLLQKGSLIRIVLRSAQHNDSILNHFGNLRAEFGDAIKWCQREQFHEKGMLGDDYVLDGSMNLTYSGLTTNDEHVIFRLDAETVAMRRIELRTKWSELLT